MTVKTTIKFNATLHGSVEAAIEAVRTAAMHAQGRDDMHDRLNKVLAELIGIEGQIRPPKNLGPYQG